MDISNGKGFAFIDISSRAALMAVLASNTTFKDSSSSKRGEGRGKQGGSGRKEDNGEGKRRSGGASAKEGARNQKGGSTAK